MVEMTETSAILRNGTSESLMLLDELGRGTSTADGTAIASSVLDEISGKNIRSIFSTHYHKLGISVPTGCVPMHMACHVTKNEETEAEEITFLYTLSPGVAEKSHGFHAARLAGLPDQVVDYGETIAKEHEILHSGISFLLAIKENDFEKAEEILRHISV